ncbi:MAG: HaeIII family restriction endonuclease [Flavobacteriaceae bacterium]|nr:HaeIII family restriction endonuclease [Flavobacteriaceae bacterium]
MFKLTPTQSGKVWEYGLSRALADYLGGANSLLIKGPRTKSQESYNLLLPIEQKRIIKAAYKVVEFLYVHDNRLKDTEHILMQSDMKGRFGDVRDILISTRKGDIGISAKHRHNALKHSRLSSTIDFGKEWYDKPCSDMYWDKVRPLFIWLSDLRDKGYMFKDIMDKKDLVYKPILDAFIQETTAHANPDLMMRYLIGRYDFYKVIKENGSVLLQSFNINGTLKWGKKVPLPKRIMTFEVKKGSKNTAIMYMEHGWSVSFRLHNARSKVEPSLKFDVQLVGTPSLLSSHEILLEDKP